MKKNKIMDYVVFGTMSVSALVILVALFCVLLSDTKHFALKIAQIDEEREQISTHVTYLASINYQSEIKGQFCIGFGIGSGKVSEQQYYVAYEVLEDSGKKLFKMPADITTIYDTLDKGAQAYVEIDENYYGVSAMRLYVPQGTITQEYDLSLE